MCEACTGLHCPCSARQRQLDAPGALWLCLVATEGLLLTDAEAQGHLVGSPQLPAEADLHLEGLPTPHHQVLDVVPIRVVLPCVLALQKVNPSDLQIALWKGIRRREKEDIDGKLLSKDSFLLLLNAAL